MKKTKQQAATPTEKRQSIAMTHNDVRLEITFRDTEPDTNVKQNIISMLTTAYQDKIIS